MKKSNLFPGFTAEASLYEATERYRVSINRDVAQVAQAGIRPQLLLGQFLRVRPTGPFGRLDCLVRTALAHAGTFVPTLVDRRGYFLKIASRIVAAHVNWVCCQRNDCPSDMPWGS